MALGEGQERGTALGQTDLEGPIEYPALSLDGLAGLLRALLPQILEELGASEALWARYLIRSLERTGARC